MALGPVVVRRTVPPAHSAAGSALGTDVLRVELLEAELKALRVDTGRLALLESGLGDLLLGGLALRFHHGLLEAPGGVPEGSPLLDLSLHLDELGMRHPLVCGEQRVMEGLGGVFSREVPRLGGRPEDLLHGVWVDVELVDGLEG